jgi:sigma-B regulation protein RsbU (phosphoserine phosphatase)
MADVSRLNRTVVTLAGGGLLLLLIFVVFAARSITRPLTALTRASEDLARGKLDTALPAVTSADEVGRLASAFGRMQRDLKRYIEELKRAVVEHDQLVAIRKELDTASHIQQSILPRTFPPFPGRTEFDIFAAMLPAREVGGDFYDFFLIGDERLGCVIGDVSGKSVPAAIFMAVSRTLVPLHSADRHLTGAMPGAGEQAPLPGEQ